MLEVRGLSKSIGGKALFEDISFTVAQGERTALIGPNGVGKSTLLRIIAAEISPDGGQVITRSQALMGYLPQELPLLFEGTILDYLRVKTGIVEIETALRDLENQDLEDEAILRKYSDAHDTYLSLNGYDFERFVRHLMDGLLLESIPATHLVQTLSGGQKTKIALIGALIRGVDLLLLDEPTNNLDLPALIWLEYFCKSRAATIVFVSHDRKFIDSVANKTIEIDWRTHGISIFPGGYTAYKEEKRRQFEHQKQLYIQQQEEIVRLEDAAKEKKYWAQMGARQVGTDNDKFARGASRDWAAVSARRARAIEKKLDQMKRIERPVERPPLRMRIDAGEDPTGVSVVCRNACFGYQPGFSIGPISIDLKYGARLALLGENGSGKSTLLKGLTGELRPLSGTVQRGGNIKLGVLTQDHKELPRSSRVGEWLQTKSGAPKQLVMNELIKFHFDIAESSKLIGDLSPGGRVRLILAEFSFRSINMLVLDEPTNHTDMEAGEALEEAIASFTGILVVVSHDRFFLDRLAINKVAVMENGHLEESTMSKYIEAAEIRSRRLQHIKVG